MMPSLKWSENMAKITVLVKSPDATGHLDEFINKLYAQTLDEWECHIVDGTPNINSQKHIDNDKITCSSLWDVSQFEFDSATEAIAKELQKEKGEGYPIIIAKDTDDYSESLLEEVLEDLKGERDGKEKSD